MSDVETISREEAKALVQNHRNGQFFTVSFVKKDGTDRTMNCRKGVRKGTAGGTLPYDPASRGLIPVWDRKIGEFRMITLDTIKTISMRGRKYKVAP